MCLLSIGIFQIYTVLMMSIIYVSNGYIFYALTYLELWPEYKCDASIHLDQCNHDLMCRVEEGKAQSWLI